MHLDDLLSRLAKNLKPSQTASERMKTRVLKRIDAQDLKAAVAKTHPTASFGQKVKARLLDRISSPAVGVLPSFKDALSPSHGQSNAIWQAMSGRLAPVRVTFVSGGLKWTAAFAIFVLIVRLMPLALLAPSTQAQSKVELLPEGGTIDVTIGGILVPVTDRYTLSNPALITTGEQGATLVLHDDAVIRLAPHTSIRLHDLSDRPEPSLPSTFSFIKGKIWLLGLLPPTVDNILVDLPTSDQLSLNEGSLTVTGAGNTVSIAMHNHRAAVRHDADTLYLVTDEKLTLSGDSVTTSELTKRDLADEWTIENIKRDSAHREVLGEMQRERREKSAGILPTSIFYPVKRVAEEVDVLFTVGNEAKAEKRIQQADTRLSEALALLHEGEKEEASAPLAEYKSNILSLAAGSGDNLVKFLIQKQLDEASADVVTISPEDDLYVVKQSVFEISAEMPHSDVKPEDVQGYLLVDKLSSIDHSLETSNSGSVTEAISLYRDIQPYLKTLLIENVGSELTALQREAKSLLANASMTLGTLQEGTPENLELAEVQNDIEQFLPKIPEKVPEASREDVPTVVQGIVDRVFLYKLPRSRKNQLLSELKNLENNPDRGSILRQLYYALPENGLARNVRLEIGKMGAQLEYEREEGVE